jgi:heme-degrading monooxygenase HmoA
VGRHLAQTVITELAILNVKAGQETEFEAAFEEAKTIIASTEGFRSLDLQRCIEEPTRYFLLVDWDSLEAHTEGFRGSAAYSEWRRLLHHFYDPFPTVEHFRLVARVP